MIQVALYSKVPFALCSEVPLGAVMFDGMRVLLLVLQATPWTPYFRTIALQMPSRSVDYIVDIAV
jgi:hypothetical protein